MTRIHLKELNIQK